MFPALWFVIKVNKTRLPLPILILIPLMLAIEIIAFLPLLILAIIKKEYIFFRLAFGFYLTRLMLAFFLNGRNFGVKIYDGKDHINITGKWIKNSLNTSSISYD